MARDNMVRAVALAAQDRMTRPLLTFPRSSPERRRRDEEERRQRVMVITEFDAGDSRSDDVRYGRRDPGIPPSPEAACEGDRPGRRRRAVRADLPVLAGVLKRVFVGAFASCGCSPPRPQRTVARRRASGNL